MRSLRWNKIIAKERTTFAMRPEPEAEEPQPWLLASGGKESIIATEESYISVFICGICCRLVSLDCFVSDCCHQPFCKTCLEDYESDCCDKDEDACPCPSCHNELRMRGSNEAKQCSTSDETLAVKSMELSQPLAFKVLKLTKTRCLHDSCTWSGNYGDFAAHSHEHRKMSVRSDLYNLGILTNNVDEYKKEQYESRSKCGRETEQSKSANWENQTLPKNTSARSSNCDSQFQETEKCNAVDSEACPLRGKCGRNDDTNGADNMESRNNQELYANAKKLKKQANAKFNAGFFTEACILYTDGISTIKETRPEAEDDKKLLSDMLSNRAATYYRCKKFDSCILDCEEAIRYEPAIEKSWIRKWRALVVKGEFLVAHSFLEEAISKLPQSRRIREEYDISLREIRTINLLQRSIENKNIADAEKILNECMEISSCDNVLLLKCYGEAMMTNGDIDGALKCVDRALELNPMYEDCLQLQGLCHFYNGNMKAAVQLLTESCFENDTPTLITSVLARLQKCHECYSEAKVQIQEGRHEEANKLLTALIQACEPLPSKSVLFSLLMADRANNFLQMHQHVNALKDCQDVIDVNPEFAAIWIIRSEVLLEIGKSSEARKELKNIRTTWGVGDSTIESTYQKVDLEWRISRANDDVGTLQRSLDDGICEDLPAVSVADSVSRKTTGTGNHTERSTVGMPICISLERKTSHSKRVERGERMAPISNKSVSLRRKSLDASERWTSHPEREKSNEDMPPMMIRVDSMYRHSIRETSGDSMERSTSIGKRELRRKSSLHERHTDSGCKIDTTSRHEVGNEKGKPRRLRRSSSIISNETERRTVNPMKSQERRKSCDLILCHTEIGGPNETEKPVGSRQSQRLKASTAMLVGSDWDWKNGETTNSTNVQQRDVPDRRFNRRSKSNDLFELRKALTDVYSGNDK